MNYRITIKELIERPIIRNDKAEEFLNKMTDDEILEWEKEVYNLIKEDNVPQKFPDVNVAFLEKSIDGSILYEIFKNN